MCHLFFDVLFWFSLMHSFWVSPSLIVGKDVQNKRMLCRWQPETTPRCCVPTSVICQLQWKLPHLSAAKSVSRPLLSTLASTWHFKTRSVPNLQPSAPFPPCRFWYFDSHSLSSTRHVKPMKSRCSLFFETMFKIEHISSFFCGQATESSQKYPGIYITIQE